MGRRCNYQSNIPLRDTEGVISEGVIEDLVANKLREQGYYVTEKLFFYQLL